MVRFNAYLKSFTQQLPLGKWSGEAVPNSAHANPTQYVALALRRVPLIFLGICIPACVGITISMVLVSVGLALLAQYKS